MLPQFNIGKSGENYIKYILNQQEFKCELNNDYALRYDYDLSVIMDDLKFTIEAKYDVYSVKSGNIAIEVFNCKSNCESGIYSTLADVWVHLIPEKESKNIQAYAINTHKLRHFVETVAPLKKIIAGGDKNANLQIYKIENILPEFVRFDNVTNKKTMYNIFSDILDFTRIASKRV